MGALVTCTPMYLSFGAHLANTIDKHNWHVLLNTFLLTPYLLQGSQNNYILLSLVRTKNVGHLRDVRRLIVAMSRARLGLYVFGRVNIFSGSRKNSNIKYSFVLLPGREIFLRLTLLNDQPSFSKIINFLHCASYYIRRVIEKLFLLWYWGLGSSENARDHWWLK